VPASDVVVEGYPAEEIAALAQQRGVELIVMGTHGRTGMRKVLLGSVAERVIAIAPCPVLTVRTT
jgi:nucleotide-binding universal stress UspA family protein